MWFAATQLDPSRSGAERLGCQAISTHKINVGSARRELGRVSPWERRAGLRRGWKAGDELRHWTLFAQPPARLRRHRFAAANFRSYSLGRGPRTEPRGCYRPQTNIFFKKKSPGLAKTTLINMCVSPCLPVSPCTTGLSSSAPPPISCVCACVLSRLGSFCAHEASDAGLGSLNGLAVPPFILCPP